jgi:hypothetical protein
MLFATIRHLIPQPRQPEQPRRYVGRHRVPEPAEIPEPEPAPAEEIPQPA